MYLRAEGGGEKSWSLPEELECITLGLERSVAFWVANDGINNK